MKNAIRYLRFVAATGRVPQQDDLERSFCVNSGKVGHIACGWCPVHHKPRYICGDFAPRREGG